MMKEQQMVQDFHEKFGSTVGETIGLRDAELSAALIAEEARETCEALLNGDIVEAIDGLADTIYVCLGAAVRMGIDLEPFFEEVHRSNMAKDGGSTREDGKIMKPEGWLPPQIQTLLYDQIVNGATYHGR